jgi:hypothetical protein
MIMHASSIVGLAGSLSGLFGRGRQGMIVSLVEA